MRRYLIILLVIATSLVVPSPMVRITGHGITDHGMKNKIMGMIPVQVPGTISNEAFGKRIILNYQPY